MQAKTNIEAQADNQINFSVGDTIITADNHSVIIKVGGVEMVLDSNGLVVKGGEIKSE